MCVDACLHTDVVYPQRLRESPLHTRPALVPPQPPLPMSVCRASASARAAPQPPGSGGPGQARWALGSVAWEEAAQCRSGRAAVDAAMGFPLSPPQSALSSVWRDGGGSSLRKAFPLILGLSPTHWHRRQGFNCCCRWLSYLTQALMKVYRLMCLFLETGRDSA